MTANDADGEASIAIVIPALNEQEAIGPLVRTVWMHSALAALPVERVIVVDNGSTDHTAEVARAAGAEVVDEPRRGYGWACLAGVKAAEGADVVLLIDGDGSDDLDGAARVARVVARGEADLAVGARVRGRRERGALTPQQRVGNRAGSLVLRLAYGLDVSDLGPTRAIRRGALLRLDMREMGFGWSTEMLAKAARAGLRVREVAVDYHRRTAGKSKVAGTLRGTVRASVHILRTLARYRRWSPHESMGQPRRALVIVARLPQPGTTKTRLGRVIGHEAAAALYAAFLHDLGARFTAAGRRDGYDLFWYCALPEGGDLGNFAAIVPPGGALLRQGDGPLGHRLWEGFRELAGHGYEHILVLGSDSPHVPAHTVAQAFRALETHDVVIGPAQDGGYYLLGQRAPLLNCFSDIEMSTPRVFDETVQHVRAVGRSLALLSQTFDVDEASDLEALREALAGAPSWQADPAPATSTALAALAPRPMAASTIAPASLPGLIPEGDIDVA